MFDHSDQLNLRDFRLLKVARHFRVGPRTKVLIGRNEAENELLSHNIQPGEATLRWLDGSSPLGVLMGVVDDALLETSAKILLRYTRAEAGAECRVKVVIDDNERIIVVPNEFSDPAIESYRV